MGVIKPDPFETLLEIEQKSRTYAKPLPRKQSLGQTWQGMGFLSSNIHYAVPLDEIKEVLQVPELTPVPAGVAWFRGVSNLRGHLLAITDLEFFMQAMQATEKPITSVTGVTPSSRILVVDSEGSLSGFLVQGVLGVQRFSKEKIDEVKKQYDDGNIIWEILSLSALTRTHLFNHIVTQVLA